MSGSSRNVQRHLLLISEAIANSEDEELTNLLVSTRDCISALSTRPARVPAGLLAIGEFFFSQIFFHSPKKNNLTNLLAVEQEEHLYEAQDHAADLSAENAELHASEAFLFKRLEVFKFAYQQECDTSSRYKQERSAVAAKLKELLGAFKDLNEHSIAQETRIEYLEARNEELRVQLADAQRLEPSLQMDRSPVLPSVWDEDEDLDFEDPSPKRQPHPPADQAWQPEHSESLTPTQPAPSTEKKRPPTPIDGHSQRPAKRALFPFAVSTRGTATNPIDVDLEDSE